MMTPNLRHKGIYSLSFDDNDEIILCIDRVPSTNVNTNGRPSLTFNIVKEDLSFT